jgi:hypothetical protein
MQVTELDGRHTGRNKFKYYIEPQINRYKFRDEWLSDFLAWRAWCWEVWGPGCELRFATDRRNNLNPLWGWQTEFTNQRLYLRSDSEMTMFLLKWKNNEN